MNVYFIKFVPKMCKCFFIEDAKFYDLQGSFLILLKKI